MNKIEKCVLGLKDLLFVEKESDFSYKAVGFLQKYKKTLTLCTILILILACRIYSIWCVSDVFWDEQDILNHIQSIIETGKDAQGNYYPLFPKVGEGLATYTYLYPMICALSIIGVTPIRARFVQQLLTIGACFLTAIGMKIWTKERRIFWITLFISLTLPWGFVQANRIWDPSFVPVYFALYFLFFSLLMKSEFQSKIRTNIYAIVTYASLVMLATVYPPARIPAVAMWIYSLVWMIKKKRIGRNTIIIVFLISSLTALPLAINILKPEFNARSAELLIFNQDMYWYQEIHLLFKSLGDLFNPNFLFISGDRIYRHSIPIFGMLGTIAIVPLWRLLRSEKYSSVMCYMIFSIVMTYLSVSLTYDYQPHGLRSCLAWMPFSILIALGWDKFLNEKNAKSRFLWYLIMILQFVLYFVFYILIHRGIIKLEV